MTGNEEFEVGSFGDGAGNQIRVGVEEVVRQVQGFHIPQEDGSEF